MGEPGIFGLPGFKGFPGLRGEKGESFKSGFEVRNTATKFRLCNLLYFHALRVNLGLMDLQGCLARHLLH